MKCIDEKNALKYVLSLNSRTRYGQYKEILEQAESLYPKKITGEQIYFSKYSKTETLVYITKDVKKDKKLLSPALYEKNHKKPYIKSSKGISKKDCVFQYRSSDYITRAILLVILVVVAFASYLVFSGELERLNELKAQRALLESQEARKALSLKKELTLKAETLEKEYKMLLENRKRKISDSLVILFSSLSENVQIDEMNITDDTFSLFIRCDNPLEILSSLERHPEIKTISLEKLAREGSRESAVMRGKFAPLKTEYYLPLGLDEKIKELNSKIEELKAQTENAKWESSSIFLIHIKSALETAGCDLKSFSSRNMDTKITAEISLECNSDSLILFLKDNANQFSVETLRIRRRDSFIQADIKASGELKDIVKEQTNSEQGLEDISDYFGGKKQREIEPVKQSVRKQSNFSFVGKARKNNNEYCVFKDERSGKIYRLLVSSDASNNNTCFVTNDGNFIINIDNEKYEVRK